MNPVANPSPSSKPSVPQRPLLSHSTLGNKVVQRSWWRNWLYPVLFMLSMLLSLSTYLTLDSIQQSVDAYVADNQRTIVGGDVVLTSKQDWSPQVLDVVQALPDKQVVYDYQFNAMLSSVTAGEATDTATKATQPQTLLARIKAVSPAYPLFGEVTLASGKPLWQVLSTDSVVVETQVLTTLNLNIGDTVQIGEGTFTIADELISEPDRPLTAFGFGARVLIASDALPATDLLGARSRVNYRIELTGSPDAMTQVQSQLIALMPADTDPTRLADPVFEVETADDSDTSITRVSDNVLKFLKLLVIAVLFLSAVAQLGVIQAFIGREQQTTAIRRALGESVASIKTSYTRVFIGMAGLACVGSVVLSFGLLAFGKQYLTAVLPADIALAINPLSILKVSVVALVITWLMMQYSLYAVTHTKPSAVLKQDTQPRGNRPKWGWYGIGLTLAYALLAWEFGSWLTGGQALLGMMGLAGGFWLLAKGWLWVLGWLASKRTFGWLGRTAIHNLSRKGNQSGLFFVTLALSVAVLTMVTLLNHSLNAQFVQAYPEDAPNLFLLDVQSEQHEGINTLIASVSDEPLTYYPVIRARIRDVNGVPASQIESGTEDEPTRIFNLSYGDTLMDTEFIQEAVRDGELYTPIETTESDGTVTEQTSTSDSVVPMSILDTASDMLGTKIGDRIRFNIQGIEIVGQITSIRERFERTPSPFFYFLFEPEVLATAPQIQFATASVPSDTIPTLQAKLAGDYPAITTIDGGAIAEQVQGFVGQMSQLVAVFTGLALFTGLMVLITSLLSTSQDRLRDSASFRLLGMQTRDLYAINVLEIGVLGLSAGAFAVLGAGGLAWLAITQWFDLRFAVPWVSLGVGAVVLVGLLVAIAVVYVRLVIGRGIMARVRGMV